MSTIKTIPYKLIKSPNKNVISIQMPAKYLKLRSDFTKITVLDPQLEKQWLADQDAGTLGTIDDVDDFLDKI